MGSEMCIRDSPTLSVFDHSFHNSVIANHGLDLGVVGSDFHQFHLTNVFAQSKIKFQLFFPVQTIITIDFLAQDSDGICFGYLLPSALL